MKAYTDEQVKQIEDALEEAQTYTSSATWSPSMTEELQAALATLRSGRDGGEAVAWIRTTDITELTDSEPETDGWTPLFAAPQSAQPLITVESSLRFRLESEQQKSTDLLDEVRELKGKLAQPAPLTDEQIEAEFCNMVGLESGINPAAADTKRALVWFKKGIRFAAHGISAQPPQGEVK